MLRFPKETEKTAKNIDDAIAEAMNELNVKDKEDLNIEIIDEGNKGFLGIGQKGAHIKAQLKDPNAVLAKQFLSSIFDAMNLDVSIKAKSEEDSLKVDLEGDSMGIIIGKRGDTLDSLQYLTSLVVNHENNDYIRLTIDTENYREKRQEALLSLAKRLAQKVARTGKKHTLEPMNPYERRIIHSSLQDNDQVTTFSVGEDPYRKVVIAPKNPPAHKKPQTSSYTNSSYASSYAEYKKTAPRHDTVKKAENFEAYLSAPENDFLNSDDTDE